jgi:hypothetical protein
MSNQAFSIHGHFYQPPREDPLTGEIPQEPGAMPYRNWNERIHDHCYRPNALLGNFERISFNIGPTLMDWMSEYDQRTVAKIIEQDRFNLERHGIGNAMAQSYNHTILPLASRDDKITQVRWGIADFRHRFGHQPLGMWLPETAVDYETLQILASQKIQFTILAPWQADTNSLDTSHPYKVQLPGGQSIAVFFYDQDLSTRISFDPAATTNADLFITQFLMNKYHSNGKKAPQLVLVASDGELYGHHQPFRDKFLSYLMGGALVPHPVQATYPALWLKQHPATRRMDILPFTSWSCHHGVTRWMGSCSCTPHSEWKAPLRQALVEIGSLVDEQYLRFAQTYINDPWELRHNYIQVVLAETSFDELVAGHAKRMPDEANLMKLKLLLSAQYERQRIFTSCGWFFDDFDRIEPRNNVSYAAQAVWLTFLATGVDLSEKAGTYLRQVKSWRTGVRADTVFNHHLQRARSSQVYRPYIK